MHIGPPLDFTSHRSSLYKWSSCLLSLSSLKLISQQLIAFKFVSRPVHLGPPLIFPPYFVGVPFSVEEIFYLRSLFPSNLSQGPSFLGRTWILPPVFWWAFWFKFPEEIFQISFPSPFYFSEIPVPVYIRPPLVSIQLFPHLGFLIQFLRIVPGPVYLRPWILLRLLLVYFTNRFTFHRHPLSKFLSLSI